MLLLLKFILLLRVVLEVCYFVKVKLISTLLDDVAVNNLRRVGDQKKYNVYLFFGNHLNITITETKTDTLRTLEHNNCISSLQQDTKLVTLSAFAGKHYIWKLSLMN